MACLLPERLGGSKLAGADHANMGSVSGEKKSVSSSVLWASLVAQMVKNLPAIQETRVQSLSWEDLLDKGMATHSIILSWRIPWTEEPGGLQSIGSQRVGHD